MLGRHDRALDHQDVEPGVERRADDRIPAGTWRTHFHVPIFTQGMNAWSSTRSEIERCLASFPGDRPLPTIEVETYAWDVLPNCLYAGDEGLASGIAEELRWLRAMIRSLDEGNAR